MRDPRNPKIEVSTEERGEVGVIALRGELDSTSGVSLDEALAAVESETLKSIVIDLSELEFMDSTGLHLLTGAERRAVSSGRRLVLVRGPEQVQRVFEVTGLDIHLDFVDDLESFVSG